MIKTGIFGGSFNPIHNGHISLAKQLKEKAGLDEVWLMVSPQNPLKMHDDLLLDEARLIMARKALEGVEGIFASDYEMHLPKPSYTWNTLQALSRDYPNREFVLMIGGDNWELFHKWYHAQDILKHYSIVVYPRRNATINVTTSQKNPQFIEAELIDISSTEIRHRIKAGQDIRHLVPTVVSEIIKKNKFYA